MDNKLTTTFEYVLVFVTIVTVTSIIVHSLQKRKDVFVDRSVTAVKEVCTCK